MVPTLRWNPWKQPLSFISLITFGAVTFLQTQMELSWLHYRQSEQRSSPTHPHTKTALCRRADGTTMAQDDRERIYMEELQIQTKRSIGGERAHQSVWILVDGTWTLDVIIVALCFVYSTCLSYFHYCQLNYKLSTCLFIFKSTFGECCVCII